MNHGGDQEIYFSAKLILLADTLYSGNIKKCKKG